MTGARPELQLRASALQCAAVAHAVQMLISQLTTPVAVTGAYYWTHLGVVLLGYGLVAALVISFKAGSAWLGAVLALPVLASSWRDLLAASQFAPFVAGRRWLQQDRAQRWRLRSNGFASNTKRGD